MNKKKKKKRETLAFANHDVIQELARDLTGEMKQHFARQKLNLIRRLFAYDQKLSGSEESDRVVLWIQGYDVTPEQETQGYTGNFAKISIVPTQDGLFRLVMETFPRDRRFHPRGRQPPRQYPNPGHPAMRAMERKKIFPSKETAREKLADLRKYPYTTLITPDDCRTMVFSRSYATPENNSPVRVWHLYIEECEGGYQINGHTRAPIERRELKSTINEVELPFRVDECFPTNHTLVDFIFGIEEFVEQPLTDDEADERAG